MNMFSRFYQLTEEQEDVTTGSKGNLKGKQVRDTEMSMKMEAKLLFSATWGVLGYLNPCREGRIACRSDQLRTELQERASQAGGCAADRSPVPISQPRSREALLRLHRDEPREAT